MKGEFVMPNTRSFCDQENCEHASVPPIVEVRDHLGALAVHVLSAREDIATKPMTKRGHTYNINCRPVNTTYVHGVLFPVAFRI